MTRLSACVFALALLVAPCALAQTPQTPASTTVPDNTYGEGGTKQSLSNAQSQPLAEIFRDRNGIIREQHEWADGGDEYWGFFVGDGSSSYQWGGAIAVRPIGGPAGRWTMTIYGTGNVTLKEYGFLSKAELDREFAHWHSQMRGWINGFLRQQRPG